MASRRYSALLIAFVLTACRPAAEDSSKSAVLSARRESAIVTDVRGFASDVARDVTKDGPAAWRKHFSDSPAFFMAADGNLQFPDSVTATAGIQALSRTIQHIELK